MNYFFESTSGFLDINALMRFPLDVITQPYPKLDAGLIPSQLIREASGLL